MIRPLEPAEVPLLLLLGVDKQLPANLAAQEPVLMVVLRREGMTPRNGDFVPAPRAPVNAGVGRGDPGMEDLVEGRILNLPNVDALLVERHTFPRTVWC